jgi:HAD superfamily hydrolase (TIGR01509 family)
VLNAILFDLDDTLMPDEAAANEALVAAGRLAAEWHRILPDELRDSVRRLARRIWHEHPVVAAHGGHFDVSSWEALSTRFEGDDGEMTRLRAWAATYRRRVWTDALAEHGIADPLLTDLLDCTYPTERRARYRPYPDAVPLLEQLNRRYRLGLVTNGPSDLQRDKVTQAGLEPYFNCITISREVGMMKPDPRIFFIALEQLPASPTEAVMVGDSLRHDIAGSRAAGLRSIWANYESRPAPADQVPDHVINSLAELPTVLVRLAD